MVPCPVLLVPPVVQVSQTSPQTAHSHAICSTSEPQLLCASDFIPDTPMYYIFVQFTLYITHAKLCIIYNVHSIYSFFLYIYIYIVYTICSVGSLHTSLFLFAVFIFDIVHIVNILHSLHLNATYTL